jgi:tRNA threonylcarbamoyl adenosine modification protein (Sua5/YciO/YrdC/YwlC family)
MRIEIEPYVPKPRAVKRAVEILKKDGIIVYPTDTVYGIGCRLSNKKGIDKINEMKKGPDKPRSIMLSDLKDISIYANVDNNAFRLIRKLLPGPYTVILPATKLVPKIMQSNRKTIGIRIPHNWFCELLIPELGEPIVTTSIPLGTEGLHVDPLEIEAAFGHVVDLIIDSGILPDEPSTVISLETGAIEILRQGLGKTDFIIQEEL